MDTPRHYRKLITVFTEAGLEREMTRELDALGAPGYTVVDARGRGHRGDRISSWEQNANIRLEVICDEERAKRIVKHLQTRYYQHYAMVIYLQDVEVLRPHKFDP